jgi:hypothetical protein
VQDGILLLRSLLEEIKQNAEKERKSILELYNAVILKMEQTKDMLVEEVDRSVYRKSRNLSRYLAA